MKSANILTGYRYSFSFDWLTVPSQAITYNKDSRLSWINVTAQKYIPQIIILIPVLSIFFFRLVMSSAINVEISVIPNKYKCQYILMSDAKALGLKRTIEIATSINKLVLGFILLKIT